MTGFTTITLHGKTISACGLTQADADLQTLAAIAPSSALCDRCGGFLGSERGTAYNHATGETVRRCGPCRAPMTPDEALAQLEKLGSQAGSGKNRGRVDRRDVRRRRRRSADQS